MFKIILFSLCLFFQLGALANISPGQQQNIDQCMKNHLSTPTCTALTICARQQGIPNYCQVANHACCKNSNCGSGITDCNQNAPYKVPGASSGPNSGSGLSCAGTPVKFRSVQDFMAQKLVNYSSMSFLCAPAPNSKVHCCVEISKCSGAKDVYKVDDLDGPVNQVQSSLSARVLGKCP